MKLKPIRDQVVVVCGASSGMGREAALEFARHGAKVVVASRNTEGLAAVVTQIEQSGGQAVAITADVSDYEQVKAIGARAMERFGRIDTWAHFSATSVYAPFRETTPEEFRRVTEVNLLGAAYAAMVALPHLSRDGGALIEISSIEAEIGAPYLSAYSASKHGVKGFLEVLRMEVKHERLPVSVTNIMPCGINTPFFNHARTKLGVKPMPSAPVYQPETVIRAVLHAAENPVEELIIGGGGGLFVMAKRLMPKLTDTIVARTAFRNQKTQEPKPAEAADNVFEPGSGDTRIHGDFDRQSHPTSAYTWLQLHPLVRRTLGGALLAGAATAMMMRGNRH